MVRFAVKLLSVLSVCILSVSAKETRGHRTTNAERFARGLPPLPPPKMYLPTRARGVAPGQPSNFVGTRGNPDPDISCTMTSLEYAAGLLVHAECTNDAGATVSTCLDLDSCITPDIDGNLVCGTSSYKVLKRACGYCGIGLDTTELQCTDCYGSPGVSSGVTTIKFNACLTNINGQLTCQ